MKNYSVLFSALLIFIFTITVSSAAPATPNDNWRLVFDAGIDAPFNYSTSFTPKVWLFNQGGNPVSGATVTYTYFDVNGNTQIGSGTATGSAGSYSGAAINMPNYAGKYINVLFSVSAGSNTVQEQHVFFAGQSNAAHGALWKIEVLNTSTGPSWNGNSNQRIYMKLYSDAGTPYRNNFDIPTIAIWNSAHTIVQAATAMTFEEDGVYSYTISGYANGDYYFEIYNQWSGAPTGSTRSQKRYAKTYAGFYLEANNTQSDESSPEIITVERKPYFPVDDDFVNITVHAVDNVDLPTRILHFIVNNQTVQTKTMNVLTGIEYGARLNPYLLEDNIRYRVEVSDGSHPIYSDWYMYNVQDHRGEANMSHSFVNHPAYWFGKSRQPGFADNGGDTNFDGVYSTTEKDNVAYLSTPDQYPYFKDMTRIKVQSLILDPTGKPVQNLTNVKAWLSNNSRQAPGTHNREKVMTEEPAKGPGVYTATWEGSPDVAGNDLLTWNDDAKAIWGNYTSGNVYSVYIDVNNDGSPEENITWLAYNFGDTAWGATDISKTFDGHADIESPGAGCAKGSCHKMVGDVVTRTKPGATCPDCHGVYKNANNGNWPVSTGNSVINDRIVYGNSTGHPRINTTNVTTCGDETCHNVAAGTTSPAIIDIPGYPTGTRVNGTFRAEYPNPIQCGEHHNYAAAKIPVEEGHNSMVACKYCHGGSHDNSRLKDYNISIQGTNTSNVNRGTPGYAAGSNGKAGDCYIDCHKTQVEHSLTGMPGGASQNYAVPCDECHQNFNNASVHQENMFPYPDREWCGTCHQAPGTIERHNTSNPLDPPRIPPTQRHAQETGIRWNNTGVCPYWVENEQSCRFCHGRSYNEAYGLGRIENFFGTNVINSSIDETSYWCASCHVDNSSEVHYNYSAMASVYNYSFGVVPPEITGSTWKSDRQGYVNHDATGEIDKTDPGSYSDDKCFTCHGGDLLQSAGLDVFQHMVSEMGDAIPPVVNSVTLNTTNPNTGQSILVTVNATDNVGVTGVTANGTALTFISGSTWEGTITALSGTHFVNVQASDASDNVGYNNSAGYTTTSDITPPVITRSGSSPVTIEVGSNYVDAGATASDDVDGNITSWIVTVNPVNTSVTGTYTVTYNVNDSSNNAATEVTRTVNVVDTTAPVITRLGTSPVTVEAGSVYTDAGATASDNYDGDITGSLVTVNPVNTSVTGTYTVTYNVNDSSNNAATEVTRTVNVVDTTAPVITRLGTSPVSVEVGSVYTDAGATASDNYDGDITASIVTMNPVNTSVTGTYTVTYNVNDSSNNAAIEVTRTVNVVDTTAPVITRLGTSPVSVEVGSVYTDAGATASDNYDGDITASIVTVNPVNTSVTGTYTVTYNVNDSSNNAATEVTRTVNVVDTTAPVWSPTPSDQVTQVGTSFNYDVNAVDQSAITYSINDTVNFVIDPGTGLITNVTMLSVGDYSLNITAADDSGNSVSQVIKVTVQAEPTYSASGYVFDNNNAGLANVTVQNGTHQALTSGSGYYVITGLLNGSYNFSYAKAGFDTVYSVITVSGSDVAGADKTILDTTPPAQVTGLLNDTPTQETVNLSWNPTADASFYQIFRDSAILGTTQNTYWNDTGLSNGTTYQYLVRANDSYNNWGENSTAVSITTASGSSDTTPPAGVTNLTNVSYAQNYINWTWTDPQDADFDRVMIYLNGVYQDDVLKGVQYFNTTVAPGTYTIGTRTVDALGNINTTTVTHTATTILPAVRFINGMVMNSITRAAVAGVTVSTDTNLTTTTNAIGFYSFEVSEGSYDLTARFDPAYYTNNSITVSTVGQAVAVQDIELVQKPTGTIAGSVKD